MSTFPEQPFTEFEERYFLAEILKKSTLPTSALLNLIRDTGIDPAWTEIALPNGRSLSACQQAFRSLLSRSGPTSGPVPIQPADPGLKRYKRPYSMGDPREIQPRPPSFTTVNGQQQLPPGPVTMSPIEPPRKKRGRPTKSEYERRKAEAAERNEVWPKPRKPKSQRASMEGVEATGPASGSGVSVSGPESSAEGSRTGGAAGLSGEGQQMESGGAAPTAVMFPPDTPAPTRLASPPGKRNKRPFEESMPSAGRAQHEELRTVRGEGSSDAPMSEFQTSQHLVAGMRQHGQITESSSMHMGGSPSSMQETYGSVHRHPFQGYRMEESQLEHGQAHQQQHQQKPQ